MAENKDAIRRELFQEIVAHANANRLAYGPVGMPIVCELLADVERMVYPVENFKPAPRNPPPPPEDTGGIGKRGL